MSLVLPTTLFKAIRRSDGRNVCIDTDHLTSTTKVVRDLREYDIAKGQGWVDHPREAMAQLEAEQDAVSTAAAVRAYDDQHMSPAALEESDAADRAAGVQHQPMVPEGKKKRVRLVSSH
jgi:hypothetical protein